MSRRYRVCPSSRAASLGCCLSGADIEWLPDVWAASQCGGDRADSSGPVLRRRSAAGFPMVV